ncbi:hypothetical protein C2G38_2169476 [Gigaspora rosea]|uniref:Uncharacterized protein n=1 Tax=Gigaspora rosea TaxID=44941 RepID=A0A397VQ62_9GLOM|nr:hypothetical protein C2G38_2169476 [Gigaspora rosea]
MITTSNHVSMFRTNTGILNNQDVELEVLVAYDSTDDLSNIDINNFDDIKEFSVGKAFKNWDQVADFM